MLSTDIPTKLTKEFCDFFCEFIYKSINHCIAEGNFIAEFEEADVCPIYKNDGRTNKSNYRPISTLPNVSKIYQSCLYSQLYDYFDKNIFSNYQYGFGRSFSTQHALLVMIEKMKNVQLFSQIYRKLLTGSVTISSLQN